MTVTVPAPGPGAAVDPAAVVAHELTGPLQAMTAYLDLLDAEVAGGTPPGAEVIGGLRRQARRLECLAADLAGLRHLADGHLPLERRPVDLGAVVADAVGDFVAVHGGVRVRLAVGGPVPVVADPARLGRLVANLLTNAARHSPPRRPVTVTVAGDGGGAATVSVRDHGPGVPAAVLPRLFTPRACLDGCGGAGLGLYLAAGIARAHGGTLTYALARGGGACFTLALPAASAATG